MRYNTKEVLHLERENRLLKIFIYTLYISAFTFGGGYVIISIMKKKFVDELGWITEDEMLDFTAIAQSSPGAVAVNAAILLGFKMAGLPGALVAVLGTVIPPFTIITVISFFYTAFKDSKIVSAVLKGMQSGVAAVIVDVAVNLLTNMYKKSGISSVTIMAIAFAATWFFDINVIYIIIACAIIGAVRVFHDSRKEAKV